MTMQLNDMSQVERAIPRHYSFTEPFWQGTRERKLMVQYCPVARRYQFFPRPVSIYTGMRNLEWRQVSGRGKIFAHMITHVARGPFVGHTPFAAVIVQLEEGVNMISNLIDCPADAIATGLPVTVTWQPLSDGTNLPLFVPDKVDA